MDTVNDAATGCHGHLERRQTRGPVEWSRTLALRGTTGNQHLYVTAPARRVYQTPENELLVHVLDAIPRTARHSGWDQVLPRYEPAEVIRERLAEATKWQQSRMLSAVDRVAPAPRTAARIRTGRNAQHYAAVIGAYDRLVSLVEQMDRSAVRNAVENAGLVTADEPVLFELLTTFRILAALKRLGWQMKPFTLFHGHVHTSGRHRDGRTLDLWYQGGPPDLTDQSRYREVLHAHGLARQRLRPDLVLHWPAADGHRRWLLVECKLSQSGGVARAARHALADLLMYRRDFSHALAAIPNPYGLGVAWGADLHPDTSSEITLCTPDTLQAAMHQIII